MKYNIKNIGVCTLFLMGTACTGNFLDINTNPYEVDDQMMETNGYIIAASLTSIASTVISTDVNTTQFTECLLGGPLGGYFVSSNSNWKNTFENYNPTDDWSRVFMSSDRIIPTLYSNLSNLSTRTDDEVVFAIADIMKVAAMHRVTDVYGPIPYSKIEVGGALQVSYDSQEDVYNKFFEELNASIDVLTKNITGGISATADNIYSGSAEQWCKFANSLKLRLAMRIVYADQTKAEAMAEEAVSHEVGVMSSNLDNAYVRNFGSVGNPLYVAVNYNSGDSNTGGDTHTAADITSYMNAFNDPRREQYFFASEWAEQDYNYMGMRRGIEIPDFNTAGKYYAGVKVAIDSPLCWMNAAEVAFLKAEAAEIFGFSMGGDAESFYNEGIRLSFEQWGASGYEAYIAQDVATSIIYNDPADTNSYGTPLSTLNVAWDSSASKSDKQERIITQKWIANWMLGNEAWADYRRTGFPRLIPVALNKSGGIVSDELGPRRMPYPLTEITTNYDNYQDAVTNLLNGVDNMATRVWWDSNPAINY